MSFVTPGAILGGNLRVGLEDSLRPGKGRMAAANAGHVARIRRIPGIATPRRGRDAADQGRKQSRLPRHMGRERG